MNPFDLLALPDANSDLAYKWIVTLFPDTSTSAFGAAFATFSGSLAFLGSLFIAWHVLVGVVSTAYSGKILGDQFHQIYAPLRVVLGFGMLVPVSDGYSAVHFLLRDVVSVAAINLGNAPIKVYVSGLTTGDQSANIIGQQGSAVAKQFLYLEACTAVVNGLTENRFLNWGTTISPQRATVVQNTKKSSWGLFTANGEVYETTLWDYDECGSLSFTSSTPEQTAAIGNFYTTRINATKQLQAAVEGMVSASQIGDYFGKYDFSDVGDNGLSEELLKMNYITPSLLSTYSSVQTSWNSSVGSAASNVFKTDNANQATNLKALIDARGFMAAGTLERSLAQISAKASSLASESPTTTGSSLEGEYAVAYNNLRAVVTQIYSNGSGSLYAQGEALPTSAGDDGGIRAAFWSTMTHYLVRPAPGTADHDALLLDPVGGMISFGHTLLVGFQAGMLALIAANALAGAGVGVGDSLAGLAGFGIASQALSAVLNFLSEWFGYVLIIVLIVGLLHAFVLPAIPFIMVMVMGISWLVMFLEAAIAGILWAFAFLRMDGAQLFDRNQAPGVSLLFNLFLRPAIGMLAFIGGTLLLPVILGTLITLWDNVAALQMTMDFTGFFHWAASNILFFAIMWHIYLRIFGLIPNIADHVAHWMGIGTSPSFGDGNETQAAVGAAVGVAMATRQAPVVPKGRPRPAPGTPPPGGNDGDKGKDGK